MKIGKMDFFTGKFDGVLSTKETINDNRITTWIGVIDNYEYKIYVFLFLRVLVRKKMDSNYVW